MAYATGQYAPYPFIDQIARAARFVPADPPGSKLELEPMLQCSPSYPHRRRPFKSARAFASAWPSGLRDHLDDEVAAAIRGS
jgi:hypothetical protein